MEDAVGTEVADLGEAEEPEPQGTNKAIDLATTSGDGSISLLRLWLIRTLLSERKL